MSANVFGQIFQIFILITTLAICWMWRINLKILIQFPENTSSFKNFIKKSDINLGARDEKGSFGYIPDVSIQYLGKKTPKTNNIIDKCSKSASNMDPVTFDTLAKIRTNIVHRQNNEKDKPRVLCMVYTTEKYHSTMLNAIINTWAKSCDGFFAGSNKTDPSLGAIDIIHLGPETYGNMWQKIRSMWAYTYSNYLDDYDYFHICGDDTYLLLDNLRDYFSSDDITQLLNGHMDVLSRTNQYIHRWQKERPRPLLLATPLVHQKNKKRMMYPAGGSGYTLNKAAVKLLVEEALPNYLQNAEDSREDVFIASVFGHFGVVVSDTRDEHGLFRYMYWNPLSFVNRVKKIYYADHSLLPDGIDKVSKETVSIHVNYNKQKKRGFIEKRDTEDLMYRFHAILSGECDIKLGLQKTKK